MSEQRRSPRIPVNLSARYQAGEVVLHGWAENLSTEGMFFALPEARPIFDDLAAFDGDVELEIDDGALTARGEVRWIDGSKPGMGIKFTSVSDAAKLAELIGT